MLVITYLCWGKSLTLSVKRVPSQNRELLGLKLVIVSAADALTLCVARSSTTTKLLLYGDKALPPRRALLLTPSRSWKMIKIANIFLCIYEINKHYMYKGYSHKAPTIRLLTSYAVMPCLCLNNITVTSYWARWRHKSPASPLFTQPFIRCRSKKASKLSVTGLCVGNSPGTGEFPAQMASNAENVSIWWRHHDIRATHSYITRVKVHPLISHGNI